MKSGKDQEEIELAFVITAQVPEIIARHISGLNNIGRYNLKPKVSITLHDIYWDLPDRSLDARKIALRTRRTKESVWVTLKGPSAITDEGIARRMEMEDLWSRDAVSAVFEALKREGLRLPSSASAELNGSGDSMQAFGFQMVQDRSTTRMPYCIIDADATDGFAIGELAVDETRYSVAGKSISVWQVEIESKVPDGEVMIKEIADKLTDQYGDRLRRWNFGKLVTGYALENLTNQGVLPDLMSDENILNPAAYDVIAEHLEGKSNALLS